MSLRLSEQLIRVRFFALQHIMKNVSDGNRYLRIPHHPTINHSSRDDENIQTHTHTHAGQALELIKADEIFHGFGVQIYA